MPVLLDQGASRHTILGSPREISASDFTCTIDLALINNMPDSALEGTERQFAELVAAASGDMLIRLRVYSLPDVPRALPARRYIDETYSSIDSLWGSPPDGLIVTGTEPRAAVLTDEPYWSALARVVDWAQYTTVSTIWSCLAAHAAVLHMDGIHRRLLPEKRSGVFTCANVSDHLLAAGLPRRFAIPHSRCNDLDQGELAACGYTILSSSEQGGIDSFVKQKQSTFVFFQGHPEYDAETLFREYRRDVARFLKEERESYPAMPEQYFAREARNRLIAFRERALVARSESLLADFPMVETELTNTWRHVAISIYRNWLRAIFAEKERRPSTMTGISSRRAARPAAPHGPAQLIAIEGDRILPFTPPTAASGVTRHAPRRGPAAMGTPAVRPKA
jgi:homoserine O-succinyltransferase/O-acetyltransferase